MSVVDQFIEHLQLVRQDENCFVGHNKPTGSPGHIFGGQVIGQALSAASQTVDNRFCHALSCHFLDQGNFNQPIHYRVNPIREGKSFSARQVTASQQNHIILTMEASFHVETEGLQLSSPMPATEPPEQLPGTKTFKPEFDKMNRQGLYAFLVSESIFEFRYIDKPSYISTKNRPAKQQLWFRSTEPLPCEPSLMRVVLSYISDLNFARTLTLPFLEQAGEKGFQLASLNQSMWIHHTPDLNDWLLFDMQGTIATGDRALVKGEIFNRHGSLIATVVQEALLRINDPCKKHGSSGPE